VLGFNRRTVVRPPHSHFSEFFPFKSLLDFLLNGGRLRAASVSFDHAVKTHGAPSKHYEEMFFALQKRDDTLKAQKKKGQGGSTFTAVDVDDAIDSWDEPNADYKSVGGGSAAAAATAGNPPRHGGPKLTSAAASISASASAPYGASLKTNLRKVNAVLRQQEYHATTTETATRARKLTDEGVFRSKSGKLIDANPTEAGERSNLTGAAASNDPDGGASGVYMSGLLAVEDGKVIQCQSCGLEFGTVLGFFSVGVFLLEEC
jgi:hypothetical protein